MNTPARVLQLYRPDAPRVGGVLLVLLAGIAMGVVKPWPLALIVDGVLGDKPLPNWAANSLGLLTPAEKLGALVLALFALHLGQGAILALGNFLAIGIGLRGLRRVREEVFARLQRLSLRFHQGASAGDLIHRAAWDTYAFQTLFQQGVVTVFSAVAALGFMLAVMVRVNGTLTLVALATVPALVLAIRFFGRRMSERSAAAQAADSSVTALVQQGISALPLVQSYTREEHEAARFGEHSGRAQATRLAQHGWEVAYGLAVAAVFALGTAATVWFGAQQVQAGQLTVGGLLVFLAYLAQLYDPLNQLSHVGATLATAGAAARRVLEVLDTPEEVRDAPDARPVHGPRFQGPGSALSERTEPLLVRGAITFDHVSFRYQPERDILRGVTFSLQPGECAALIGPSGVGKTTLMNLVPRFFDPVAGAVRLDGADLRTLRLRDLRAQIAVVLQEPILLPASIADNIAYGKPGATRAEIEAAARAAHADDFIRKLPRGYDTPVGEAAARLSVGERQRLNLARAFLKDAPILLLDEPTSALDAESEAAVVASIFDLMQGRTTLMVAHRLSTIRRVDKVIVLEDGRVSEMGSPAELAARGGYFARVASGQVALA
jgi:ATP-binding cassette subfamily B protein/subfamily B ATP-binding cassette protein MsbA